MLDYIREVYPGIFLAEIPLKGNPLKSINIYIIKSDDGNLIIDTGFNSEEVLRYTRGFIEDLSLDLENTGLFLTHLHSDHTGLVNFYDSLGVRIYMGEADGAMHRDFMDRYGRHWPEIERYGHMQGLDEDSLRIEDHPGYKYRPREDFSYTALNPGDIMNLGKFRFEVMDLSGHTPGMIGLLDRDKNILFCGDHILGKITPNIQFWGFEFGDSLGTYLDNLEAVRKLKIKHLFSSHRYLVDNVDERIDELEAHHDRRLKEAVKALSEKDCTVRDVTKALQWDISARNWDEFPKAQKWFAAGEAHAHLEHLRFKGIADFYRDEDDVLHYFLAKK